MQTLPGNVMFPRTAAIQLFAIIHMHMASSRQNSRTCSLFRLDVTRRHRRRRLQRLRLTTSRLCSPLATASAGNSSASGRAGELRAQALLAGSGQRSRASLRSTTQACHASSQLACSRRRRRRRDPALAEQPASPTRLDSTRLD